MKNNCDDIALNYIVSYFFNEFLPVIVNGNMEFLYVPEYQSSTAKHY
jgi:hypothetical protein